jgi:Ca2+-binding RTX toxin-like protein
MARLHTPKAGRRGRARLDVERLNDRALPSATIGYNPDLQVVTIDGDDRPNVARVRQVDARLVVEADGQTRYFEAGKVRGLVFVGHAGNDYFANLTGVAVQASGGDGNDVLTGGAGADRLDGGSGNDYLAGTGGDDRLNGGAGDDRLDGGAGRDQLDGGAGDDWLFGGDGNDSLFGNTGRNYFHGGAGRDVLRSWSTLDVNLAPDVNDIGYVPSLTNPLTGTPDTAAPASPAAVDVVAVVDPVTAVAPAVSDVQG